MDNYKPNSILFTGGCGFIGSNTINHLMKQYPNCFFLNLDRLDYCANTKNVHPTGTGRYKFVEGNIENFDMVYHLLREYNIDTIIHMAAQTHVDNSFGNSIQFTKTNILGTHVLLEASRKYQKIRRFIHVSTDEVIGELTVDDPGCKEDCIMMPNNPYSATKAAAEFMVQAYMKSFKIPAIITRCNNVYGPHQYPEKLIPKFSLKLFNKEKCPIQGNGDNLRTFIHVSDVAKAFDIILRKGKLEEIYNIGTNHEYSVLEITYKLIDLISKKNIDSDYEDFMEFVEDRNFNDFRYCLNTDKLEELGWKAEKDFEEGLKETVDWYLRSFECNYWELE